MFIDRISMVLSVMLFRIIFVQSCWAFGGEVRRYLENATYWSSVTLLNLAYNILVFWFWPKGWRKWQRNHCVPLVQLKFTQRPTLHIVCGKYFQLGDRAKERFFYDLESSVCSSFQFCRPMQLTGSTSCTFFLVIFAINGGTDRQSQNIQG